jgi:hypothetical protein
MIIVIVIIKWILSQKIDLQSHSQFHEGFFCYINATFVIFKDV